MATTKETQARVARMRAEDLRRRLEAGEPATVLDARAPQAWEASGEKIRGAIRIDPHDLHIASGWPRDRLTVVY